MNTYTENQIESFTTSGLFETERAWVAAGLDCEIVNTGGGIYCLVAELPNGMTAVRGEDAFIIFTNEEWNEWIKETEEVYPGDYEEQLNWIKTVQESNVTWTLIG